MFAFHLPDAVEAHGDDGDSQILGEEADAGLESGHFAGLGIVDLAFGEDQDAVAAVDGFSGEAKAFAVNPIFELSVDSWFIRSAACLS